MKALVQMRRYKLQITGCYFGKVTSYEKLIMYKYTWYCIEGYYIGQDLHTIPRKALKQGGISIDHNIVTGVVHVEMGISFIDKLQQE